MEAFDDILTFDQSCPLHEQIRRYLEQRIRLGFLKPGEQLPSEAELQRLFSVSRSPVRQALNALKSEGLIYRSQGRGSFVRDQNIDGSLNQMLSFGHFGEDLRNSGSSLEIKTLSVEMTEGSQEIAEALRCEEVKQIIYLQRLFIVDKEPLILFHHYLPPMLPLEVFKQAGDFQSLYQLLIGEGIEPFEGVQSIGATLANEKTAGLLGVELPAAILSIKQVYYAVMGNPVCYSSFLVRADRYKYKVRLMKSID